MASGLLALILIGWFSVDRNQTLIRQSIKVRLGELAREVERRAFPPEAGSESVESLHELPATLLADLSTRFPDPIVLLDTDGSAIRVVQPDPAIFNVRLGPPSRGLVMPEGVGRILREGRSIVKSRRPEIDPESSWAVAPIYGAADQLVGGVMVKPLRSTIEMELSAVDAPFLPSLVAVAAFAFCTTFLLGVYLKRRVVKPPA